MILVDIVQGQCISYCDSTTLHGFQYIPKSGLKESYPFKKKNFLIFFLRNLLEASLECNNCCNLYSRDQAEYNFKHSAFYNYSLMLKCISNKFICYSAYFVIQLVS